MSWSLREIALPRTDSGAAVQAVLVLTILIIALVAVRRDRDLRLLATGGLVFMTALLALRTLH